MNRLNDSKDTHAKVKVSSPTRRSWDVHLGQSKTWLLVFPTLSTRHLGVRFKTGPVSQNVFMKCYISSCQLIACKPVRMKFRLIFFFLTNLYTDTKLNINVILITSSVCFVCHIYDFYTRNTT